MSRLHVLRVFCADDDSGGNGLGVFLDGAEVPEARRQAVAAELGFSETVFVDDRAHGRARIFTPAVELDFAGHPTVGTAWLLAREGTPVDVLRVPAGDVRVRHDGDLAFVTARPEWGPPWELVELGGAAEVEALDGAPAGHDLALTWAWIEEAAGTVRTRAFGPRVGIPEDEATGSAAALLCAHLGRAIDIRQGRGSRILAAPAGDGLVEIGGRSALDEVREHAAA